MVGFPRWLKLASFVPYEPCNLKCRHKVWVIAQTHYKCSSDGPGKEKSTFYPGTWHILGQVNFTRVKVSNVYFTRFYLYPLNAVLYLAYLRFLLEYFYFYPLPVTTCQIGRSCTLICHAQDTQLSFLLHLNWLELCCIAYLWSKSLFDSSISVRHKRKSHF